MNLDIGVAQGGDFRVVGMARAAVARELRDAGLETLVDDARLVAGELVTNAVLHGGGCAGVRAVIDGGSVRIEVADRSPTTPVLAHVGEASMTGRGLRLVAMLVRHWGVTPLPEGKVVWAELSPEGAMGVADAEALGGAPASEAPADGLHITVSLGNVPTDLLLAAKAHVDNLVREFTLAAAGAETGLTAEVPAHLASLIEGVVHRFAEARGSIKRQAIEAARRGESHTRLELSLTAESVAAGEDYLRALDEADAYCRAVRLLTLETPPQHRIFRRWYVESLLDQLRASAAGLPSQRPVSFEERLLDEIDDAAAAQRAAQRAARLYVVADALSRAATPEAVADAALVEGVAALGASGGGLLLAQQGDGGLAVPGTVGYSPEVVARLRAEPLDAELPGATALRTGEAVWIESREERDSRFPDMAQFEPTAVAMCAVPLTVGGRTLGALRFSFVEPRLFDDDQRRFVVALGAQVAQALDRAQLQAERIDVSRRLQRSLLPPHIPTIAGVDVAAVYHPFGAGLEVGGDFYDVWEIAAGRWGLAIGDATGTGPEAAAQTALVRHTIRAVAMFERRPGRVIEGLNDALLTAGNGGYAERFCTVIVGALSVVQGTVRVELASGGHPNPVLRTAEGRIGEIPMDGSLVGCFADITVSSTTVTLAPGDTLLLLTDGVLETRRGTEFFDVDGVRAVLEQPHDSAAAVARAVEDAVLEFGGGEPNDDVALLVLRCEG